MKIEFLKERTTRVGHGLDMRVDGEPWDVCYDICTVLCENDVTINLGEKTMVVATCASCNVRCKVIDKPFDEVVSELREAIKESSLSLEGDEARSGDEHTFHVVPPADDGMWGPIHVIRMTGNDTRSHGWDKELTDDVLNTL
jgi:hypothetical protein